MDDDAIGRLDATAQAELVRCGQLTAEELVHTAIARIERLNPTLNAVITPLFDRALEQARQITADGPFAGVPYLLKDLVVEMAGVPFHEGSAFLRDHVSTVDQELAVRLRKAGLIVLGRTNTPEFGLLPTTEPTLFGPTRNPWDLSRTPGGSSGGSAAAVAAGLVPFAHGNDLAGSIRFPASCCGLFGFKPTRGRNPLGPRYGDAIAGWAVEHALTRSIRDSAALLDVTSGPDLGDPYPAPPPLRPFAAEIGVDPGRLRIAFTATPPGGGPVHPDCVAALRDAVELLTELGHEVFEADLPGLDATVGAAITTILDGAVGWVVDHWIRRMGREPAPGELDAATLYYRERSRRVTAAHYLLAVEDTQAFARTVARFFTTVDAWLTPTLTEPPVRLGEIVSTMDNPAGAIERGAPFVAFPAIVANITGAPAMSVPLYWSSGGLPIGVHLLGRYGADATLFRLAAQLEQARPWANRWPSTGEWPCWTSCTGPRE